MMSALNKDLTPQEIHDTLFELLASHGETILTTYLDFELPHFGGPTKGDIFFLIDPSISNEQLEGTRIACDWVREINRNGLFSVTLHLVPIHDAWYPDPPRVRPLR